MRVYNSFPPGYRADMRQLGYMFHDDRVVSEDWCLFRDPDIPVPSVDFLSELLWDQHHPNRRDMKNLVDSDHLSDLTR